MYLIKDSLRDYINEAQNSELKISAARAKFIADPNILKLMKMIPERMEGPNFVSHPKVERLIGLVINHFVQHQQETNGVETRVMIFSQYRESVIEIVGHLEKHSPLVKVMSFVGQASSKTGTKGMNQKEQLKVIKDFQSGNYNVLVSTSIGEEGLDIGEIDLIFCFDAQGSPIRMLQRMGRTGRKRKGEIILLLTKGKEEESFRSAQQKYKAVQKSITEGSKRLVMYDGKNSNLFPVGFRPVCEKKILHIETVQPIVSNTNGKKKKIKTTTEKKARTLKNVAKQDCSDIGSNLNEKKSKNNDIDLDTSESDVSFDEIDLKPVKKPRVKGKLQKKKDHSLSDLSDNDKLTFAVIKKKNSQESNPEKSFVAECLENDLGIIERQDKETPQSFDDISSSAEKQIIILPKETQELVSDNASIDRSIKELSEIPGEIYRKRPSSQIEVHNGRLIEMDTDSSSPLFKTPSLVRARKIDCTPGTEKQPVRQIEGTPIIIGRRNNDLLRQRIQARKRPRKEPTLRRTPIIKHLDRPERIQKLKVKEKKEMPKELEGLYDLEAAVSSEAVVSSDEVDGEGDDSDTGFCVDDNSNPNDASFYRKMLISPQATISNFNNLIQNRRPVILSQQDGDDSDSQGKFSRMLSFRKFS